ncbi:MAG: hypothetical protein DYG90_00400 [Chloroflexi bacterium CFX6]|nr:hypothetical protein [Chloroflexi bacterium CFX6]
MLAREMVERRDQDQPLAVVVEPEAAAAREGAVVLAEHPERLGCRVARHDGALVHGDATVEAEGLDGPGDGGHVSLVVVALPQIEVGEAAVGWFVHEHCPVE